MKSKKLGLLTAMMGMASMQDTMYSNPTLSNKDIKELAEQRRRKQEAFESERRKKRGLKEYFYGENVIYARNQKNADRKARNKGYL